jgi:putative transposase
MAMEYRLAQWAQALHDRAAAGQSIDELCQAKGVSRNTYFYWQRKVREAAAQQMITAGQSQALVPSGWAAVQEAVPEPLESLTLRIGGAEIEVRQGFDEALLASVIKTLSQAC